MEGKLKSKYHFALKMMKYKSLEAFEDALQVITSHVTSCTYHAHVFSVDLSHFSPLILVQFKKPFQLFSSLKPTEENDRDEFLISLILSSQQ